MSQNADVVVDGKFSEPDDYFIAIQKASYVVTSDFLESSEVTRIASLSNKK